jgi:hypothetical protein
MARCSHGRSVVTSDLSRPAAVTATRNLPSPVPASPRDPRQPPSSHIARAPEPSTGEATTSTSQHTRRITFHAAPPRMSPHSASRTVSGSMDDSMALWNLRALAGRHLPFADTDRRRAQTRSSMVCSLWRVPVASWSSTIPLGHWGHCSLRPPAPSLSQSLLAASYQLFPARRDFCVVGPPSRAGNARKMPNLCFVSAGWVRRVFQVESVKVKVGSGNPSIPRKLVAHHTSS